MRYFAMLMCCLPGLAFSQQKLLFENYSSLQGLSQNNCYAISQDGNGFMWFGTQDGLNRYDGRQFRVYSQQNEWGRVLPGNIISSLFFDADKNLLWVGTIQGACLYDPVKDSLVRISRRFPLAEALERIPIKKIISFTRDEYWVITFNNGLLHINTKTNSISSFFTEEDNQANVTSIASLGNHIYVSLLYSIYELKPSGSSFNIVPFHPGFPFAQIRELFSYQEALWIGTMTSGCYVVENPQEPKANILLSKIASGGIAGFVSDKGNHLWIGTRGSGIYRYDALTKEVTVAKQKEHDPTSLCSNYALSVFRDRQGIVWFGFYGGIAKYDPLRFQFNTIDENSSLNGSLDDRLIVKMYPFNDTVNFVGTLNKGILEWHKRNNLFVHYPGSEMVNTAPNVIYDITKDDQGKIWAASCGGLMDVEPQTKRITYYSEKKLPELNKLYALIKLKKADSLLIASENGFRFFSLKEKKWRTLPENMKVTTFMGGLYVYTGRFIYEDEQNILWICTEGSGLVRYDYLHNKFSIVDPVNKVSLFIRHLLPDGDRFWLPTDNGLIVYDWKKNQVVKHIVIDVNASNVCYAIEKDNSGYYWLSTNLGLCKLNGKAEILQRYNTGNGLSYLEFNTASSLKDSSGQLYFGGVGGITAFNPSGLRRNDFSPRPFITGVQVNDNPWPLPENPDLVQELDFGHTENFLTLFFGVNNFSNEANNLFSYRLRGLNNNWSDASTGNTARFTSLPPGNYSFELRSANSDGIWSPEVKTMAIIIHPAWWQTTGFRAMVVISLATLVYFAIRRRIAAIRHEAALKQELAELEMKALHAQMNPHFIFNSLNSIKEMIWNDQKQNASRYLSKFAKMIRTTLEQSRQPFITVEQCADHLRQYLEMEKLRFDDFSYHIEIDDRLRTGEARIAPMLIQPLAENAIWHGLRNKDGDRALCIRFSGDGNQVICEIEDNGIGLRQSLAGRSGALAAHQSVGIANIQERLRLLNEKYNMNCSLEISDKSELPGETGCGTLAVLKMTL